MEVYPRSPTKRSSWYILVLKLEVLQEVLRCFGDPVLSESPDWYQNHSTLSHVSTPWIPTLPTLEMIGFRIPRSCVFPSNLGTCEMSTQPETPELIHPSPRSKWSKWSKWSKLVVKSPWKFPNPPQSPLGIGAALRSWPRTINTSSSSSSLGTRPPWRMAIGKWLPSPKIKGLGQGLGVSVQHTSEY